MLKPQRDEEIGRLIQFARRAKSRPYAASPVELRTWAWRTSACDVDRRPRRLRSRQPASLEKVKRLYALSLTVQQTARRSCSSDLRSSSRVPSPFTGADRWRLRVSWTGPVSGRLTVSGTLADAADPAGGGGSQPGRWSNARGWPGTRITRGEVANEESAV